MPTSTAHAAMGGTPDLMDAAELLRRILDGDTGVPLAAMVDLPALFGANGTDAGCYGPQVLYASHQDGATGSESGQLPSGDVGLWLATDAASGQPCAVAQMGKRVLGAKRQGMQGLLMAAIMRRTVAISSTLTMPSAGGSTDLTTALRAALVLLAPASPLTIEAATIGLNSGGTYTYRLVANNGASGAGAKRGEMILRHTPGSSDTVYAGTLQVAGFTLENDAAFGCSDEIDAATGLYKVARVGSIKYSRNGTSIAFGSRSAQYCGHATAGSGSNDAAQVATFTSDNQIDAAQQISGSTRGTVLGWRGNFTRYAGDFNKDSAAGNFLLAWQAGTGDSHARALAATSSVSAATSVRTIDGYYAYADEIAATSGALLGMICNWAGPGNSHSTGLQFQSQRATLASGASLFALGSSLITYAPTVSCASTTTQFDVDANGTLAVGEGVGTSASLDGLTGANTTVDQELRARGGGAHSLF
jgi:hypothetical protein